MDKLEVMVADLQKINKAILYSFDERKLEVERSTCISNIDNQCRLIKSNLKDDDRDRFINIIKKYLAVQEEYKIKKKELFATQLLMRNPNLTEIEVNDIVESGQVNKTEFYNYVTDRYKAILKLERDINEIKELTIGMYALVDSQGLKVDKIADHIEAAKINCQDANEELVEAYKIKRKCIIL